MNEINKKEASDKLENNPSRIKNSFCSYYATNKHCKLLNRLKRLAQPRIIRVRATSTSGRRKHKDFRYDTASKSLIKKKGLRISSVNN